MRLPYASLYASLRGESVTARIGRAAAHLRLDLVEKQVARLILREHLRADVGAGVEYTKQRGAAGKKRVHRARKCFLARHFVTALALLTPLRRCHCANRCGAKLAVHCILGPRRQGDDAREQAP